jgi:membrane protein required for colicin V production
MNWLDIIFAVLIIAGFIKGYTDGFIRQIVFFFALIAAIFLCSKVSVNLRDYIISIDFFPDNSITIMSYILAFILIAGIIMLAGWIIHKMISVTPLSLLNHLAGALLGFIITILLVSLTLNIIDGLDRNSVIISRETKEESRYYSSLKDLVPAFYPVGLFIWNEEEVTK